MSGIATDLLRENKTDERLYSLVSLSSCLKNAFSESIYDIMD